LTTTTDEVEGSPFREGAVILSTLAQPLRKRLTRMTAPFCWKKQDGARGRCRVFISFLLCFQLAVLRKEKLRQAIFHRFFNEPIWPGRKKGSHSRLRLILCRHPFLSGGFIAEIPRLERDARSLHMVVFVEFDKRDIEPWLGKLSNTKRNDQE